MIRRISYFTLFAYGVLMVHITGYADVPVQEERLREHVVYLSETIGERNIYTYEKLQATAAYIQESFEQYGYRPQTQTYLVEKKPCANIIAAKKSTARPDEIILVGAHYDSVYGSPGADDNASAVASLLELARFSAAVDTKRTVKFVAFPNEEPPFFLTGDMGSRHYAKEARKKGENIVAMICLESLGYYSQKRRSQSYPPIFNLFYPDTANFIAVVGDFGSRGLIREVKDAFKRGTDFPVESVATFRFVSGVDFSDHGSFWKYGYKAVMITDTAFYRNPYYHTAEDTPEKLDYQSLAEVTRGLYNVVLELANQ